MLTFNTERLLTASEAADLLGMTHGRVCQLLRAGLMKGHKVGRLVWLIPESEAKKFVEKPTVGRPRSRQKTYSS